MTKIKSCTLWFDEKTASVKFKQHAVWTEIWKKPANWSGGQMHRWIFLKQKLYCISFYTIFCRLSAFHHEWPQFPQSWWVLICLLGQCLNHWYRIKGSHGGKDLNCKKLTSVICGVITLTFTYPRGVHHFHYIG